jgi:hypothetical protein
MTGASTLGAVVTEKSVAGLDAGATPSEAPANGVNPAVRGGARTTPCICRSASTPPG